MTPSNFWLVLVSTAVFGSFAKVIEKVQSGNVIHTGRQGVNNPKSERCPDGTVFMRDCYWCECHWSRDGAWGRCDNQQCPSTWDCQKSMELVSEEDCYGHCSCDNETKVMTCEKQGCKEEIAVETTTVIDTGRRGLPNQKSRTCPNGVKYLNSCNWCECHDEGMGGGWGTCEHYYCTGDWSCELSLALAQDVNCYGHCTCSNETKITTCEKQGCDPSKPNNK